MKSAQMLETNNLKKLLETPRTREACKRTGIKPVELEVRQFQVINTDKT
jgi:hypothetical protein